MKYSFIAQQKNTYPVRLMCETLGVSRNGYNHYAKVTSQKQDPEREELQKLVVEISAESERTYGSRRIQAALCATGRRVMQIIDHRVEPQLHNHFRAALIAIQQSQSCGKSTACASAAGGYPSSVNAKFTSVFNSPHQGLLAIFKAGRERILQREYCQI